MCGARGWPVHNAWPRPSCSHRFAPRDGDPRPRPSHGHRTTRIARTANYFRDWSYTQTCFIICVVVFCLWVYEFWCFQNSQLLDSFLPSHHCFKSFAIPHFGGLVFNFLLRQCICCLYRLIGVQFEEFCCLLLGIPPQTLWMKGFYHLTWLIVSTGFPHVVFVFRVGFSCACCCVFICLFILWHHWRRKSTTNRPGGKMMAYILLFFPHDIIKLY